MGWLNTLVDEAKFAHDINYLGPAYVHAELAAKQLESEGKTEEAKEIRAAMLDSTVDGAMMAGLGNVVWGAGKALLRKQLMPAIRLGAGMAGGMGGMYAGDKLVHTLSDGKYDTWGDMIQDKTKGAIGSTLAHLSNPLAILGGFAGGWGANKAYTGTKRGKLDVLSGALDGLIENTKLGPSFIDQAAFLGKFGWAPKQKIRYRHGSKLADLKTFVPKHDRWDVVTHGADPNMYFVTDQSTPVSASNMMDRRAYQYTGNIIAEKPMVQIGEIKPAGVKNNSRNQLIARARQQGADTYIMQGIEDNKVSNLNIVARFIGPEGEAVQGGAASIKWYGPTMGKTTAAKVSDKLVDIDPLLKPIRAKHAERLGLKISDPKVSADPAYKQEVADFVLEWRANPENQGKTLVASTKHLLDPQYKINFANDPSIPDFETFAARNKARGFKETDEQLRAWYNSILELGRDLNINNRYVSDIEGNALKGYVFDEVTGEFIPDVETSALLQENLLQMISQAATEALLDAANYFGSPNYLKIITRGGGDEKLARAISDAKQLEILNAEIEAAHLGRTSERLLGTNERIAGHPNKTTLNIDELATPNQVIETVYHELGGHGASANIEHKPAKWMNDLAVKNNEALKQENPILAVVAEHNSKYRPTETDLSELGKALRDGDIAKLLTLKEWEGEISTPEQAKAFYEYLVSDDGMQEISARVNANRIAKFSGKKNTWNKSQLKIFTPEYRRKIARSLWSLLPFSVAATSAKDSELTQEHKQGGSIHIKKENKGKFTDYCGGKVTEECIRKGKNSSNPTTRKRANFAWVARHKFKHEEGGKINYLNYFK